MAKLEAVAGEITAQAHRLRYLLETEWFQNQETLDLVTMLCHDLESVNLPKLVGKYRKRGKLIQKEQDRRHQRRIDRSMRWVKEAREFGLELENTHYASSIVDALFRNSFISKEVADQMQQDIDDSSIVNKLFADSVVSEVNTKRETKREAKKRQQTTTENKPLLKELPVTDGEFGLMMREHVENTENTETKPKRRYTKPIKVKR